MRTFLIALILLVLAFLAWALFTSPAEPEVAPTLAASATFTTESESSATATHPAGEAGECTLTTTGASTIYSRPSQDARIFSEVGTNFEAPVSARTADGWLGFSPGTAQAANIGPFRLRWIDSADIVLSGDCLHIPEMWGAPANICFTMPMESVNIYANPDSSSSIVTTLEIGDFAAVLGVAGDQWAQVDLGQGNTGQSGLGWMERAAFNLNGPCSDLPVVTP